MVLIKDGECNIILPGQNYSAPHCGGHIFIWSNDRNVINVVKSETMRENTAQISLRLTQISQFTQN